MAENKLQSEMSELPFTIYKNLFQQADEGMIICDSKGTIVSWNEALSQFTGKNEKDVINTPIWNYPDLLVNNPDFNKVENHIKHLLGTNTLVKGLGVQRFKYKVKDNVNILMEVSARETTIKDKRFYVIYFRDFTRQYRKEIELAGPDDNLRELAEMLPEIVYEIDTTGKFIYVNNKAFDLFGYTPEDLKEGLFCFEVIIPEQRNQLRTNILRIINEDIEFSGNEYYAVKKNGEIFPIIIFSNPIKREGKTVSIRGVVIDLTDKLDLINKIDDKENYFYSLIKNTYDIIAVYNDKYELIYNSPETKNLLSFPENVNNSFQLADFIHPDDNLFVSQNIDELLNDKQKVITMEFRVKSNEGSWINLESIATNHLDNPMINGIIINSRIVDERKKAEIEIKKSDRRFKNLAEVLPQIVFETGKGGIISFLNKAGFNMLKFSREDYTNGIHIRQLFDEKEYAGFWENACNSETDKQFAKNHYNILRKDGSSFPAIVFADILDDTSDYIELRGIIIDMTERVEVEKKLKESQLKLKSIIDSLQDLIFYKDKDSKYMGGNTAFQNYINKDSEEQFIGLTDFDIFPSDVAELLVDQDKQMIVDKQVKINELWTENVLGQKVLFETRKTPLILPDGTFLGIVGISRDITSKFTLESIKADMNRNADFLSNTALQFLELAKDESIYDVICQGLSDYLSESIIILSVYDEETKINEPKVVNLPKSIMDNSEYTASNEKIEKFAWNVDAALFSELISGRITEVTNSNHAELYGNIKKLFIGTELEKTFTGDLYVSGLANEGHLFGGLIIICKKGFIIEYPGVVDTFLYQASLTLNKQKIEKELIKAKEEAIQAGELKTAFLANMSHEIRTPMNGIIGFSELLRNINLTQDKKEKYVNVITENSKYLLTLINDIIDISKIQSGQVSVSYTTYSINKLLWELHHFFSLALISKGKEHIKLTLNCELRDGEDFILVDTVRLQQIINNLIGNAIKFTNEGAINFGYKLTEDRQLIFHVSDTGIGLAENKREMIFDRFTQADYSSTRKYGGTGLGLSISKGLVELMGGKIWVESELDKGSTFYFTLPYKPFDNIEIPIETIHMAEMNFSYRSILIVEDDPGSLMLLEELLSSYKIKLVKTEFGIQAVEICKNTADIDLVLMDINLPDIDGYEATRRIKKFKPTLPIIAQTANAFKNEEVLAYESGCDDYISKPIDAEQLYFKLKKFSR